MLNRRRFLRSSASLAALAAPPPHRPNVILILADDLGYGDLGSYGCEIPTPSLDRLASQGVRFTQAYVAAPICSPSRVGITTGQCPSRHLIHSFLNNRASHRRLGMRDFLDPAAPSIARTFQQAGYATAHFGKWHMGGGRDVGDAPLPSAYGFDESLTTFEGLGDRVLAPGNLSGMSAKLGRGEIIRAPHHEVTRHFTDRAVDFIDRQRRHPFFLQLWPNDVHDPFAPAPHLLHKYERFSSNRYLQQYYATLDEMDRQIGRVLARLDAHAIASHTIVVFLSDNGPTAWPRYYKEGFAPPGSTAGFRGRKWSLYEGGIRVPLIVRYPGHTPAGAVDTTTIASSLDLFPSLCRLARITPPAVDFDGEDLSSAFLGKPQTRRKDLFWEYGRDASYLRPGRTGDQSPNLAIRSGQWKALVNDNGSGLELYDFSRSQSERQNIAAQQPEVARRLSQRLLAWRRALPALPTPPA
jgi:arylsulfatase A-like enzyme